MAEMPEPDCRAWIIIMGLRDIKNNPPIVHQPQEIEPAAQAALQAYKTRHPDKHPELIFHWMKGVFSFSAVELTDLPPFEGVICYGASTKPAEELEEMLGLLAEHLQVQFGQVMAEIHVEGKIYLSGRNLQIGRL